MRIPLLAVLLVGCAQASRPAPPGAEAPSSAALAATSITAPAPRPVTLSATVSRNNLECPQGRCAGVVQSGGAIALDRVSPGTRFRYGAGPERAVEDLGADKRQDRFLVPAPSLDAELAAQPPASLLLGPYDESELLTLPLELIFTDGVVVRASIPFSKSRIQLAFIERMKQVAQGPVRFPGDDARTGPPRAMWIEFPAAVRGRADTVAELDWVLLIDQPSRAVTCERSRGGLGHAAGGRVENVGRIAQRWEVGATQGPAWRNGAPTAPHPISVVPVQAQNCSAHGGKPRTHFASASAPQPGFE